LPVREGGHDAGLDIGRQLIELAFLATGAGRLAALTRGQLCWRVQGNSFRHLNDRVERKRVMALAQAREIDAIFVTELSRWGRSTQDLVQTLDDLHSWKVSVLAQTGLSFDLSTASAKLMRTIMAGLAEFERDLIQRVGEIWPPSG
jgi:hypothetical protein